MENQTQPKNFISGPVGLVLDVSDAPLSAQQVEERTRSLPDGTSSTETMASQIYRDSAGRMRIEWRTPSSLGEAFAIVYLFDPVARSIVYLLVDSKVAGYFVRPHSGSGPFHMGFPVVLERSSTKWQTRTEGLGTRVIEGVEVEGARTVRTSEDQPPLIAVHENWWSLTLRLTMADEDRGPHWKRTAKLRNLERREPDPALFVIPPDYAIQDW